MSLAEDGRLELDAPVAAVVPEVPGAGVVTPRMLLGHTAGYPEIYVTPELAPLFPPDAGEDGDEPPPDDAGSAYDPDRVFTWPMLLPGYRDPVEPGAHWAYSNGGYILLTELLVRLLGGPEGLAAAWTKLTDRADAGLGDDVLTMDRATVRHLARGYDRRPDGSIEDPYAAHSPSGVPTDLFGLPFGDGLFAATAAGVGRFLDGLFARRTVLRPDVLEQMVATTPQAAAADLPDYPDMTTYALGTFRVGPEGAWQGHSGTYAGFTARGAASHARGETLVVLTNLDAAGHPASIVWDALAEQLEELRAADAAG
jgi:CubicO group peptidase (beta-lactamase class C family)